MKSDFPAPVSWNCPVCAFRVGGWPDSNGRVKLTCPSCRTPMQHRRFKRRYTCIEIFDTAYRFEEEKTENDAQLCLWPDCNSVMSKSTV